MEFRIFVINTGSTSTKLSLFVGSGEVYSDEIYHDPQELKEIPTLFDQLPYRMSAIRNAVKEAGLDLSNLSAIAARGGTFGSAEGGAYLIEEKLLEACRHPMINHPSNLAAFIADEIAGEAGCRAYIYDAVCVDEVTDIAKVTGLHEIKRTFFSHVLNTRAVAGVEAAKSGLRYDQMNFIAAHLGGGISINAHEHGRIVDVVCDDEGPMSPQRAGKLNGKSYVKLCFSGSYSKESMTRRLNSEGGLYDHLGTGDLRVIEKNIIAGDKRSEFVLEAMGYQISKDICALAAVLKGQVDRIIITGGAAHCNRLVESIIDRVQFLAPVAVYPGSMEMEALAQGVSRVLSGDEEYKVWG